MTAPKTTARAYADAERLCRQPPSGPLHRGPRPRPSPGCPRARSGRREGSCGAWRPWARARQPTGSRSPPASCSQPRAKPGGQHRCRESSRSAPTRCRTSSRTSSGSWMPPRPSTARTVLRSASCATRSRSSARRRRSSSGRPGDRLRRPRGSRRPPRARGRRPMRAPRCLARRHGRPARRAARQAGSQHSSYEMSSGGDPRPAARSTGRRRRRGAVRRLAGLRTTTIPPRRPRCRQSVRARARTRAGLDAYLEQARVGGSEVRRRRTPTPRRAPPSAGLRALSRQTQP